jgi:hypothetical protein
MLAQFKEKVLFSIESSLNTLKTFTERFSIFILRNVNSRLLIRTYLVFVLVLVLVLRPLVFQNTEESVLALRKIS